MLIDVDKIVDKSPHNDHCELAMKMAVRAAQKWLRNGSGLALKWP